MLHCSRLVERENDLFWIAGGERDARALIEVIEIKALRPQARSAPLEGRLFLIQRRHARFKRSLLGLDVHVSEEALMAGHSMRAEIEDRRPQPHAHHRRTALRQPLTPSIRRHVESKR